MAETTATHAAEADPRASKHTIVTTTPMPSARTPAALPLAATAGPQSKPVTSAQVIEVASGNTTSQRRSRGGAFSWRTALIEACVPNFEKFHVQASFPNA